MRGSVLFSLFISLIGPSLANEERVIRKSSGNGPRGLYRGTATYSDESPKTEEDEVASIHVYRDLFTLLRTIDKWISLQTHHLLEHYVYYTDPEHHLNEMQANAPTPEFESTLADNEMIAKCAMDPDDPDCRNLQYLHTNRGRRPPVAAPITSQFAGRTERPSTSIASAMPTRDDCFGNKQDGRFCASQMPSQSSIPTGVPGRISSTPEPTAEPISTTPVPTEESIATPQPTEQTTTIPEPTAQPIVFVGKPIGDFTAPSKAPETSAPTQLSESPTFGSFNIGEEPKPSPGPSRVDDPVTLTPTENPSDFPTGSPTLTPTEEPSERPSELPWSNPGQGKSEFFTRTPTASPSQPPTAVHSESPSAAPTPVASAPPSFLSSEGPSAAPSPFPSTQPSAMPSKGPTGSPLFPSAAPSAPPTGAPTCTKGDLDVCIALDMSGSVCTPVSRDHPDFALTDCTDCHNDCYEDDDFDRDVCCSNFWDILTFTEELLQRLTALPLEQEFSLVSFATEAKIEMELDDADEASDVLGDLEYSGGGTNTGAAISSCAETLEDSDNHRVILLVTDGEPTRPPGGSWGSGPKDFATLAADNAKEDDISIVPVYVASTSGNENTIAFLESLGSSDSSFLRVDDFGLLDGLIDDLLAIIPCQDSSD